MSTPRINPNDPQWTAYVLGELAADERIEQLLEASSDAQALVDELRTSASAVEEALEAEPVIGLTPAQRAVIRRAADAESPRGFTPSLPWMAAFATTTLVVIASVVLLRTPSPAPVTRVAVNSGADTSLPASNAATAPANTTAPAPASRPRATPTAPAALAAPAAPAATVAPPGAPTITPPAASTPGLVVDTFAPTSTNAGLTLTGTVRDTSGALLPGVTVSLAATSANTAPRSTLTDGSGRYTFDGLDAAQSYHVTAALAGFQTASADLSSAQVARAQQDFTMAVGSLAETVTITGATPALDSLSAARQVVRPSEAPAASPAPLGRAGLFQNGAGRGGIVGGIPVNNGLAPRGTGSFFPGPRSSAETYASVGENTFVRVSQEPLATFSIDVDTASYSNVRRFLNQNQLPPADAVRIEELVNYFTYDYAHPTGARPIAATIAATAAPWNPSHRLVRVGVRARDIDTGRRPSSNLVFLIDVSGSMNMPQKLPLVKSALKLLVDQLGENDLVSIVTYASGTRVALAPTSADRKDVIVRTIDNLQPGGSTNGSGGIQLAYAQATDAFIQGGINRVVLMTDGDFNVGISNPTDLTRLIETKARSGVFLSVLGFGMGNLKDATLERLADTGNGNYAYIDTLNEARKVLVEQMSGTLVTVAKDVKIQVDFNPAKVEAYRLIGYENRVLRPEDFNNDAKDAGDMGAGHTVTAMFEIVPRGGSVPGGSIDPSVFQPAPKPPARTTNSNDLLVVRMRYKLPDAAESTRLDVPFADRGVAFGKADEDFRFAASVAAFGMILKKSEYRGDATLAWVLDTATSSLGADRGGYRHEFVALVQQAIALTNRAAGVHFEISR
jgi:Ca-activated chloride channel family protein